MPASLELLSSQKIQIMPRIAHIHTHLATFDAELYDHEAPDTVANFCRLAQRGFYDGLIFFKIIPRTLIQTGCPNNDGKGGPGYTIPCELNGGKQYHDLGVLSMAHARRNGGGSQFFICLSRRNVEHLDGNHTCFGKVTTNLELLDNLVYGDVIEGIDISGAPD